LEYCWCNASRPEACAWQLPHQDAKKLSKITFDVSLRSKDELILAHVFNVSKPINKSPTVRASTLLMGDSSSLLFPQLKKINNNTIKMWFFITYDYILKQLTIIIKPFSINLIF
tara:strand:+ start:4 stop:345 length:342 start_codon:yes stop_codon:yes gene_type:complete